MEPRYSLARVVAVVVDGGELLLGETRARRIVADYLDSLVQAERFARAVIAGLRRENFEGTVELSDPPYRGYFDAYITTLSVELAEQHQLEHVRTWYVKLKLVESDDGDTVVCVSLHPPEQPSKKQRRTP